MTTTGDTGRAGLLHRVVEQMLTTGVVTTSLRSLASQTGTSHRMLIYHFGGQEGLIRAVVDEVEARQQRALLELAAQPDLSPAELSLAFWTRLSAPNLRPLEQLFFKLYSRLLELGEAQEAARLVESWLGPAADLLVSHGYSRPEAQSLARLGLGVTRGLLLDLVATGDQQGVDDAMRTYIRQFFGE